MSWSCLTVSACRSPDLRRCARQSRSDGQSPVYGGILTNIAAALVGGPGVVPGCNMGRDVAVFEPGCRHVGLDIKGKDQVCSFFTIHQKMTMLTGDF
jgi:hypothetical protein